MTSRRMQVPRYLVAGAVVLTCVLFTPAALDPVNVVKLTALLLVALALIVLTLVHVVRDRVVHLPTGPAAWVLLALAGAFTLSAAVAPVRTTAVLGAYGRNSGLLAYLAALVLLIVALRVFTGPGASVLVGGVIISGLFTATYGLLQKAGWDAIPWNNPFNPVIAALGNPNFASGYLGIAASVAAGGALWRGWAVGWRVLCGATAGLCLIAASLSASVQGPIAAAGGLFVVAAAWVLDQSGTRRRLGLITLGTTTVAGGSVLLIGASLQSGPAARVFSDAGSRARAYYWDAALQMFRDAPVWGVGLDQYGNFWRASRSTRSLDFLPGDSYSDAAHSVPLQMLAQGGLVLGLSYAALLAVTGFALLRGLIRATGPDRMLLAAVGAGWTAYQVQSLVSIDQVPLLVLHFTLAGAVLAVSGAARFREVRLPGALAPAIVHPSDARTKRRLAAAAVPRRRSATGIDVAFLGLIAGLALTGAWQALDPLRANVLVSRAAQAIAAGDGTTAQDRYDAALELVPGQALYASLKGQLYADKVQPPMTSRARQAYEQAVAADSFDVQALKAAAGLAETEGDLERARELFRRAAELDPLNAATVLAAATFELRHSGAQTARSSLEAAVERVPGAAALWASLGDARFVLDDPSGAREAYLRALDLEPGNDVALTGVDRLATRR